MKQIIALQEYTDKHVSLYEGEIRNIGNNLADELIAKGVVAEHDEASSNKDSDEGIFVVNFDVKVNTDSGNIDLLTLDKSYQQTLEAYLNGKEIIFNTKVQYGNNPYTIYRSIPHISQGFSNGNEEGFTLVGIVITGYSTYSKTISLVKTFLDMTSGNVSVELETI